MKRLQERFRKQNIPVELADVSVYELIAFVREYEALKLEGAPLLAANRYAEKIKEICQSDGDIDLLELEMLVRDLKEAWGFFEQVKSKGSHNAELAAQRVQKTENGLFCLCQHFAVWYEQMKENVPADFAAPCASCKNRSMCGKRNYPWDDFIFPILKSQGLRIQMGSSN